MKSQPPPVLISVVKPADPRFGESLYPDIYGKCFHTKQSRQDLSSDSTLTYWRRFHLCLINLLLSPFWQKMDAKCTSVLFSVDLLVSKKYLINTISPNRELTFVCDDNLILSCPVMEVKLYWEIGFERWKERGGGLHITPQSNKQTEDPVEILMKYRWLHKFCLDSVCITSSKQSWHHF